MVVIKRRQTPEDTICELVDMRWRLAFKTNHLGGFSTDPYGLRRQDVTAAHLLNTANQCKRGTLTQTPLQEKVFVYILCFTLWRLFGKSLLSDAEYAALARHLWSGTNLDKIDKGDAIPFAHRQVFLWDIPALGKQYRRAGTMPIPVDHSTMPQPKSTSKPKLRRPKSKK